MLERIAQRLTYVAVLVVLVCAGFAQSAHATVNGTPPTPFQSFRVFGDSLSVGNTLMSNLPSQPLVNSRLLSASTARVSGVPAGANVEGAFLFWSGSQDPDAGVDRAARFTLPNGATRLVVADTCFEATANLGGAGTVDYFYCRADVTDLVAENPVGSSYNGVYGVGDVRAMPGFLSTGGACLDPRCQAFYAGWSMVMVWASEDEATLRDVALFDGFQAYDETSFSTAVSSYSIDGFDVANPPEATFRFFGLEGDALLGVPPQDADPVIGCDTCFDYVSFNGSKLFDSLNPANNIFNSTLPEGAAIGVDIDSYDVSDLVDPGDTSVRIEIGSGDNNTRTGHENGAGGGELFLVGYNVLTINRLAPNFRNRDTFITADPTEASPGEVIFYTVQVTNTGSLPAEDVVANVALPPNTEYIEGSTRLDGVAVGDVGGGSPVFSGMPLGDLSAEGDNDRRITFRLRILPDTPNGTRIETPLVVEARELAEEVVTEPAVVTVVAPTLLTPQKTALDLNGGALEPGDFITYTVRLRKDAERSAAGLTFVDDISPYAVLQSVNAGAFTDASDNAGGVNGTGQVRIEDITMPIGSSATTVSFTVRVMSAAELDDAGVDPGDIDGLLVRNQGELQADFLPSPLLTDDPATAASPDPTDLRLASAVNFRNASTFKRAEDLNGGTLEPGDLIRFTISVRNTGNQSATVDVTDSLPANLVDARLVAPVAGFTFSPAPAGTNNTGELVGFGITVGPNETIAVRIEALVDPTAPGGTTIRNVAELSVNGFPDQDQSLDTGELTVVAGAVFDDAEKTVEAVDGGFAAGDEVTYTIAFNNTGNQAGVNVLVQDVVDANLTGVTPLDGGTYDSRTRTITWSVGDVSPGERVEVRFSARINVGVTDGTRIPNQAQVFATGVDPYLTDDPSTPVADDPTVIIVSAEAAPDLLKAVEDLNGGAFEPGDPIRYTLTVRNDGRAALTDVVVTDIFPDTDIADVTVGQGGRRVAEGIRWNATTTPELASIAPRDFVVLTIEGTLLSDLSNGDVVTNFAELVSDGFAIESDDPSTAAEDDPTTLTIAAEAVLETSAKRVTDDNGGLVQPNDLLTYEIDVINTGSGTARDLIVTDPIDPNLTDVTPLDGGAFDGAGDLVWTPAAGVAPGTTLTLRFTARVALDVTNGVEISNQATITSPDIAAPVVTDDPTTSAVDDPTIVTVEIEPEFVTSTKEVFHGAGDDVFRPGDPVIYRILVVNSGAAISTQTTVLDDVPVEITDLAFAPDSEVTGDISGQSVTVTILDMRPGEARSIVLTGVVADGVPDETVVANQAQIVPDDGAPTVTDDPTTPTDDDATGFVVSSRPDLSASEKTFEDVNGGAVEPGDVVRYTIAVNNVGSSAAQDVVVTDEIDGSLEDIVVEGGRFDEVANQVVWDASSNPALSAVGVDEPVFLTFTARVVSPLENGTIVSNQAFLSTALDTVPTDDPTTASEDDPTSFQVISSFDFSDATKLARVDGTVRIGDTVAYTINFTNDGTAAAENVVVRDPLGNGLLLAEASDGGIPDAEGVVWNATTTPQLARVEPGASITLEVIALVVGPADADGQVFNQALIDADGAAEQFVTDDPSTAANDDPTAISVVSVPVLDDTTKRVEDEDGDGVFVVGETVIYTIEVRNTGDRAAQNVVVVDPLPEGVTNVRPLDGGQPLGDAIRWDASGNPALASVSPGDDGVVTLRFTGEVDEDASNNQIVSNQATVQSDTLSAQPTDDPSNGIGDDDPTEFTVFAEARLDEFEKTVEDTNGLPVLPGDTLIYTLSVVSDGSEPATGVVISDPIPAELVDVEPLDGGVFDGTNITWTAPELAVGEALVVRFAATVRGGVADGTQIRNQAAVRADNVDAVTSSDDPTTATEADPTTVVVNGSAELRATKTVFGASDLGTVGPGDTIRYEIVVRNDGDVTLPDVVISDLLPEGLEVVSTDGEILRDGIVWLADTTPQLAELDPGEAVAVAFEARVSADAPEGFQIANQADVVAGDGSSTVSDDPLTPDGPDATVVTVALSTLDATLTVEDANGGDVQPADRLTYTMVIRNAASGTQSDIIAELNLDPRLRDVVLLDGGFYDEASGQISWDQGNTPGLGTLAAGDDVVVRFEATVDAAAANGAVIPAQARVVSDQVPFGILTDDPSTATLDDPTVVVVTRSEGTDFGPTTKAVEDLNGGLVEPGDVLAYTIRVVNAGGSDAVGAVLRDATPANTTYVPGSATVDDAAVPGDENPFAAGFALDVSAAGTVEVRFSVQVDDDAVAGARVSNQAFVSDESGVLYGSDDPSTTDADDATVLVVGAAPDLERTIKRVTASDENGDGLPQVGETLVYEIEIPNDGTALAQGVVFTDTLPDNTQFVPNSLNVDGVQLTDQADEDMAEVIDQLITVRLDQIAPRTSTTVRFTVEITGGDVVTNQGFVGFDGGAEPTDDDGDPDNGDNPTVTPLNGLVDVTGTKSVTDTNGGDAEAGDLLTYTIDIAWTGATEGFVVVDWLDEGLTWTGDIVAPPGVTVTTSTQGAEILVEAAEAGSASILMAAEIADGVSSGTTLCNAIVSDQFEDPEPACVTIGTQVGTATVDGTVFRELGPRNETYDEATDELLPGYLVRVVRPNLPEFPVVEAVSDDDGAVLLTDLEAGDYLLQAWSNAGPDNGGAVFYQTPIQVAAGSLLEAAMPIDPTGVIYDAESRRSVAGVRVYLYEVDLTKDELDESRLLDADALPFPSQQGQVVPDNGLYRFDLPEGLNAEIFVDTSGAPYVFPSAQIPADDGGAIANAGERVELVDAALPEEVAEGDETYALRVRAGADGGVFKNHIPVDAIDSDIIVTKRADRVAAHVGDIVTYTVSVRNASGADLVYDTVSGTGGVVMHDAIPETFRYVDGSAVALLRDGETGEFEQFPVWAQGELLLRFGRARNGEWTPLSLPADSELEIRYFLSVGSDTTPGRSARNSAEVRSADTDTRLSNVDYVDVRVEYDPVFDQGVLMGRAFCDEDGDGRFDSGETGLPGARIFFDTGYYTDTDVEGQYHFSDIDPGLHLVKIDTRSLPPGSVIVSEEARAFNVTRGLPAVIDFGIECTSNLVDDIEVTPGDGALAEAARLRRQRYVDVLANVEDGAIEVDGVDVPLLRTTMQLAAGAVPTPVVQATAPVAQATAPVAQATASVVDTEQAPASTQQASPFADNDGAPEVAVDEAPTATDDADEAEPTAEPLPEGTDAFPRELSRQIVGLRVADDALVEPLGLRADVDPDADRWVFEVAEMPSGVVVFQRAGTNGGEVTFTWDGRNADGALVLDGQRTYEARLRSVRGESTYAAASPVLLRVDGTRERYLVNERMSGSLFNGNTPNPELRQALDALGPEIQRNAPHIVVVEAHLDDRDDDSGDSDAVTEQQARRIARYLTEELGVDASRIEARGMGIRRPVYPNIGDRTRNTNRRIEVRVIAPNPEILTAEIPEMAPIAPGVRMGQVVLPANGVAVMEGSALRPSDGVLPVMLTRHDGGTSAVLVALREGVALTRGRTALPEISVSVDLANNRADVAEASVALDALATRVEIDTPVVALNGRMLDPTPRFAFIDVPDNVEAWSFEVFERGGGSVYDNGGEGPPSRGLRWQGRTSDGIPLTAGEYEARLTLRLRGGGLTTTPPVLFAVAANAEAVEATAAPAYDDEAITLVRVNGQVVEGAADVFATTVRAASDATILIDVMRGGARAVIPVTVPSGHPATYAAEVPVTPYAIVVDPTAPPTEAPAETPMVEPSEDAPTTPPEAAAETDAPALAPVIAPGGEPSIFAPTQPVLPEPEATETDAGDTGEEEADEQPVEAPAPVEEAPAPVQEQAPASPFSPISDGRWLLRRSGSMPSFTLQQASNPFAPTDGGVPVAPEAEATPETAPEADPELTPVPVSAPAEPSAPEAAAPPRYTDLLGFYAEELDAALATDDADLNAALAASEAGQISVQLPPQGIPLESNRLPVFGTTVPTNRVWVNGIEVDVHSDGRFDTVRELPGGTSEVIVETLDLDGNRGRLAWPVEVNNASFFLMALADTAIGSRDAEIAGAHDHNSRTTDSGVLLYGQARLYMQGWISGEEILNGRWDDIEITAHMDTGKRREYESFVRETIQPDRQYPVFGDSSEQVSDVNSRGKVYVMVQADASHATWGNFNTSIQGVELLRYERNLYGAQIALDETFADEFQTELQVHVADEDEDVVQTYNFMRGTGGSVYYLENRQIVEGSERVTLVIRDSVSGIELERIPQSRNTDYTMRYREGRIMMRSPVPSVADDGLLLGDYVTSRSLLRGHHVYLEVAYDYEGGTNQSDLSYGAHVRETFYDWVSIGGGIVQESRSSSQGYRLWGIEAGVGPTQRTRVDFEYAGSESRDLGYAYSDDGGLTFDRFRLDEAGDNEQGNAILVRASAELADIIDTDRSELFNVAGYYQRADRGFFSNGRILDQGEEKFGFSSRLQMTDVHGLAFRLDRVTTSVDDLTTETLDDVAELRRQVAMVQYDYDFDPAHFTLAYERTFSDDERLDDGYRNDVVGAAIEWRVTRWLRLGLEQELLASGDDPNVIRGADTDSDAQLQDRFTTSVTAGVSVTDDVEIVATNRFRYSGENSVLLGLRAGISDDSDVYVQQRFEREADNHGSAMSTVVGGEQRYGADGSGRSYGEYHMDHGISGQRTRAVLGFGKTWNIAEGLNLDLGYERSHTLAGESVESGSHRNTASVGWEYVGNDILKLSGLFEARFDGGSTHTPASNNCLGASLTGNPAYCRDTLTAVGDRRQIVAATTLVLNPTRDLTFFGRFDLVHTQNTTLDMLESRDMEGTIGAAVRPVDIDWLNVLMRYTYLAELAPYELEINQRRDERSHVFSLSPVYELPFNLQLVNKVAYRQINLDVEGMPSVRNDLILLVNRVNYHVFSQWDVGVEYRFLRQSLTDDWLHGFLVEVNYIVADHVRLGMGYNFTKFAEDELGDFDRDASGVFFRVTAQY